MKQQLLIITDAAASANSSTTREVVDLIRECNKIGVNSSIYAARTSDGDCYKFATEGTYSWIPFYKSQSMPLRFLSENILGISLALKYLFFQKNKRKIKNILWISPTIFTLYLIVAIRATTDAHIYLMLRDMFPYWLANIGRLKINSVVYKILNGYASLQMRLASTVGVESKKSKEIFLQLFPAHQDKCEILFNWMYSDPLAGSVRNSNHPIKFIYAGNLGHAQGFVLIGALIRKYMNSNEIEFHMIGRGDGFAFLEELKYDLGVNNLFFHEQLPVEAIDNFIRQYDIGLIFLRSDINASNIPGKAMGYLLNGLPVFGSVNPECDLSEIVASNNYGILDVSGDLDSFLYLADIMLSKYRSGMYMPKSISESSRQLFSTSAALRQILNSNKEDNV